MGPGTAKHFWFSNIWIYVHLLGSSKCHYAKYEGYWSTHAFTIVADTFDFWPYEEIRCFELGSKISNFLGLIFARMWMNLSGNVISDLRMTCGCLGCVRSGKVDCSHMRSNFGNLALGGFWNLFPYFFLCDSWPLDWMVVN